MAQSSFSLFYMKASLVLRLLVKNRRMTLKQINQEWLANLHGDGQEINYKCFARYRSAIAEIFGIEILQIRIKGDYEYTIENVEDLESNELLNWSINAFSMGESVLKALSMHDRIIMEGFPSTNGHLDKVLDAMHKHIKVTIFYRKYKFEEIKQHTVDIYCMVQYRQRLYIVGNTEWGGIGTFSLDRIISMHLTGKRFDTPPDFNARDHFKYAYGVVADEKKWPPENVIIRAYDDEPNYMIDTPVHDSQGIINETKEFTDFNCYVGVTKDLVGYLLGRADRIKILSPSSLAKRIRDMHLKAASLYSDLTEE